MTCLPHCAFSHIDLLVVIACYPPYLNGECTLDIDGEGPGLISHTSYDRPVFSPVKGVLRLVSKHATLVICQPQCVAASCGFVHVTSADCNKGDMAEITTLMHNGHYLWHKVMQA